MNLSAAAAIFSISSLATANIQFYMAGSRQFLFHPSKFFFIFVFFYLIFSLVSTCSGKPARGVDSTNFFLFFSLCSSFLWLKKKISSSFPPFLIDIQRTFTINYSASSIISYYSMINLVEHGAEGRAHIFHEVNLFCVFVENVGGCCWNEPESQQPTVVLV